MIRKTLISQITSTPNIWSFSSVRVASLGRYLSNHITYPPRGMRAFRIVSKAAMTTELVHIPEIERVSPACIRILAGNPGKFALQGTNTYILGTGPKRLLVDTGEGKPSWIAALKKTLEEEKISIQSAVITHWHHDHQGGIGHLREHSPETKFYKNQPEEGQLDIADGQKFEVEGATLTAFHTPGHAVDHMVFVFQEEDALFTGDNVLGQGTTVFEDLGTYLKSLAKMEKLVSGRGYPGHGPILPQVGATITEYISHRHEREKQVLQTLAAEKDGGLWTPVELVKIIYRDYPESLHVPAANGVIQILRKLRDEDKVALEDGDKWRLTDRSSL
ncbi:putative metallo-beta-lactamase domain protein [Hypoxylon trugodes]|uniref:putative metallo-beta-lactamase domain protein n=1 Tax=Hypoxylon trugodes TaxID=326681 RepID=UPI002191D695|nr:putative metallo-beta-lactamase domain protein [Hypoxylon trugodes]KAI1385324.1 putative metallo-beta-lactamase domain protein [Hypoxylon trugodes]